MSILQIHAYKNTDYKTDNMNVLKNIYYKTVKVNFESSEMLLRIKKCSSLFRSRAVTIFYRIKNAFKNFCNTLIKLNKFAKINITKLFENKAVRECIQEQSNYIFYYHKFTSKLQLQNVNVE